MERSTLIQRLTKPSSVFKTNPFAFGGGLKNGGLSNEFNEMLNSIFRFEYMGSARFEYGAIPTFFERVANNAGKYKKAEYEVFGERVFVIYPEAIELDVENRIHELSGENYRTHESTFFRASLGMDEDYKKDKCKTCGWLELDNFFMFFTDEEMFENTAKLFGIFQKKENGIL